MLIRYKCRCFQDEAVLNVPDRTEGEDVVRWMESLQALIGDDHRKRSALCTATTMEYAKIPVPENSPGIGMKPHLDS